MPANVKPGQPNSPEILARLCRITKRFGPVTVLEDVDLEIRAGEVHVLAGENGAGKSTLIRILGGVYTDFDGQMQLAGRPYRPQNPLDAGRRGVALIHQELSLVPEMSVADNVFLGRSPCRRTGFIDDRRQRTAAVEVLRRLGLELDVSQSVASFPIATQQRIEIAKAISQQARVLVMDEPTSALNAPEVERLFQLVRHLKQQGCGIIYITHKMEEIERLADRITVLRDGRRIGSAPAAELPQDRLIQWMVGRPMTSLFPRHMPTLGDEVLGVKDFSVFPQGPAHPAAGVVRGPRGGDRRDRRSARIGSQRIARGDFRRVRQPHPRATLARRPAGDDPFAATSDPSPFGVADQRPQGDRPGRRRVHRSQHGVGGSGSAVPRRMVPQPP